MADTTSQTQQPNQETETQAAAQSVQNNANIREQGSLRTNLNWVEILVVGIILATLGWLAVTVFNMNGLLAEVKAEGNIMKEDVARIRGVLPDLGKAIAQNEIQAPVSVAMITTDPVKLENGKVVKSFKVIDTKKSELLTYTVNLTSTQDREKTLLFKGTVHDLEAQSVSFSKLYNYSNQAGQPVYTLANVDLVNSFIIKYPDTSNYRLTLSQYLGQPQIMKINTQASNWSELSLELKQNKTWLSTAQ